MRWDMSSWPMTSEALEPSIFLTVILQSCCRLRGLPVEKKRFLLWFKKEEGCWRLSGAVCELTLIKHEAGVSGRRRCCVVYGFSSQVVAGIHARSKLQQQLDHVHHVHACRMVQCCLVELNWIHIGTCRKLRRAQASLFGFMDSQQLKWCECFGIIIVIK